MFVVFVLEHLIDILAGVIDVFVAVVVGGIITGFIPWIREARREKRLRAERAKHLAARIIDVLDVYQDECVAVIDDDGSIYGPSGRQGSRKISDTLFEYWPIVPNPDVPEFPIDVDWESIDGKLMNDLWAIRDRARQVNKRIKYMMDNYISTLLEHEELHEVRHEEYADLGLRAIKATESLREQGALPEKEAMLEHEGGWDIAKTYKPVDRKVLFEETIKRTKEAGTARSIFNKEMYSGVGDGEG